MRLQIFRFFFLSLILLLLSQCQTRDKTEITIRASLLANEDHTWFKAFDYFGRTLEQRSEGRIKFEVYPSEQLAKEIESIRLIQAEVIEMTITGSTLSNWTEILTFCELPFLLKDSSDMEVLIDGPIGKKMEKEMLLKTGLRPLCFFQRGNRHLTSNRPIKSPEDLKGLIVRVPNVSSFVTAWSALGAKPTPMAFSEVFTSLQQGTIEAEENPLAMINTAGFSEVQKYVNLTGHVVSWVYPVIGEKQFQKLPKDLQEVFLNAAKEMQIYEHKLFIQNERVVSDELKDKGMVFVEVDREDFIKKAEPSIFESLSPEMQLIYKQIKSEIK